MYILINIFISTWGLGIGDWAQSPIPNSQFPIPKPQSPIPASNFYLIKKLILF